MTITRATPPNPPGLGNGLTAAEVAQRVSSGQTNHVDSVTSRSIWAIVKANVCTRFNALLGALLVLVLQTGSHADALFGVALVVNSVMGIAQEVHAKRKLDSLAVLHAPTATVLRDGAVATWPVADVVKDDLVFLRAGDQVPADGPLLLSDNLEIDESNLTGESDAVPKDLGDQVSSGTAVVAGSGWFKAATVGPEATAQKLAGEARRFTRAYSEVQHSTNVLLRWLTWVVLVLAPLSFWTQWRTRDGDSTWRDVILRGTTPLVGLVPEGLVVLTTLAFLLAAVQLTRQQALVQELPAVEGLARVDVICVDKTGTLTQGEIAFERCAALDGFSQDRVLEVLGALVHEDQPNATALAIGAAVPDPGLAVTRRVPFNSARKWSAGSVVGDTETHWALGAPEFLLDPAAHVDLFARVAALSDEGRRLVVLGQLDAPPTADGLPHVTPAALIELSEVVRPDARETLEFFARQGVQVKVISGDNPVTVAAVARRVGLDVDRAVDARTLPEDPAELAQAVEATTVFGRVTPTQKRLLVQALQRNGHTVAMTGDGVNDVLALKDADIGIAMGNGAQATKAVAQLVLLDSQFSHLPRVLAEGRRLIGNVERVASLFVAKNAMSATLLIATAILSVQFPFLPRHMTIVSTLTIGLPAAILALAPNKRRYVPGFLSRVLALSLPTGMAAGLAGFLAFTLAHGNDVQAYTVALGTLLVVNFWLLGALARPYNWWKVAVVLTMVGLASLAFVVPEFRRFFDLQLPRDDLWIPAFIGGAGVVAVEVAYRISRRLHRPPDKEGHIHLRELRADYESHATDTRRVEAEAHAAEKADE
ncbi:MAG: cation-translocating P-type ATPase [Propionibacteriaceae bacterium]|nr:cation-translocating P-type ATPase [Propionibacteriaceae bacterium]